METGAHIPVLLDEVLEHLAVQPAGRYLDCTFGRGGHAREILHRLGPSGHLFACDRDATAIAAGADVRSDPRVTLVQSRFSTLISVLGAAQLQGGLDGVLLDLGVSSPQLNEAERGFSFQHDGPLDMRMDPDSGESVADWLAHAEQDAIEHCLREYGEERHARRIARRLCEARMREPIRTTAQLASLIAAAVPRSGERIHPATRSFQALRILINDELGELARGLPTLRDSLAPGGRLCAIAFHSLEDRIVKRYFRDSARAPEFEQPPGPRFTLVTRKPVYPGEAECAANPRARSARLRVLERAA